MDKKQTTNHTRGSRTAAHRAIERIFDIAKRPKQARQSIRSVMEDYQLDDDKDLAALCATCLALCQIVMQIQQDQVSQSESLVAIRDKISTFQQDVLHDVEQKSALIHSAETSIKQSAAQICSAVKEKDSALEKIASVQSKLGGSITRLYSREGRGVVGFLTTALASIAIGMVSTVYVQHNHPEVMAPLTKLVRREVDQ